MKKTLLLTLAMLAGAMSSFAYDSATSGTTYYGSNCAAYGLSDGTVAIYIYYTTDGQTEVTFPATIQVYDGETMTAEYEVSAVGVSEWGSVYLGSDKTYQYNGTVTSVIFSEGIKTINASAFYEMTSLKSVSLPSTLTTIGDYAFTSCDALTNITCYATTAPTLGTDALKGKSEWNTIAANCVLKVPDGCALTYAANSGGGTGSWTYYDEFYKNNKIHELTYPSITPAGWSTYYNTYAYTMPKGVEGYIIDWTYEGKANLVKVYDPGDEVCPGIALLWKSTADLDAETWYTVEALASGGNTATWPVNGESAYTNLLYGYQTAQEITAPWASANGFLYYKLANDPNGLGWYWGAADGAAFESGAHKAFMAIEKTSAGARSFINMFDDSETTSILKVNREETKDKSFYNLSGQRVAQPTKGLYIVNGKKVMIK